MKSFNDVSGSTKVRIRIEGGEHEGLYLIELSDLSYQLRSNFRWQGDVLVGRRPYGRSYEEVVDRIGYRDGEIDSSFYLWDEDRPWENVQITFWNEQVDIETDIMREFLKNEIK